MATLDDIADAVVRLDGQGKCVTMNQAAVQIFRRLGRDPGRTIGKSVWELFPDLKGTVAEQQLRRALDDQRPIQDELYSPADQRWYDTQGFPSSPGVVLIFRDITEWKTGQLLRAQSHPLSSLGHRIPRPQLTRTAAQGTPKSSNHRGPCGTAPGLRRRFLPSAY